MHKSQLFNSEICHLLSQLGHTDQLVIGDAGLPIPDSTYRIDIALTYGIPSFMQVLDTVSTNMQIERIVLASEIIDKNPDIHQKILQKIKILEKNQNNCIQIDYISHELFKKQTQTCKAVIRTGECSPFANIILQSGVFF